MIRGGSRDVPLDRTKASSARQRHGLRVACHRFFSRRGFANRSGAATPLGLAESGSPLCSAAAVQNLAENERFMGRGKPPDVVGASVARPASSASGNSPSASLRRCPSLRITPGASSPIVFPTPTGLHPPRPPTAATPSGLMVRAGLYNLSDADIAGVAGPR